MDDEMPFNDKAQQFDRLWDGILRRCERSKSLKFRQYILEHVRQMRRPLNRGMLDGTGWANQKEIADRENF